MVIKSKIKQIFNEKLRSQIAAICDTKRIQNNLEKMDLLVRLLVTSGLQFEHLGGATNRYVIMCDGYAIKIAVDAQGFKDNYMEYSLTQEMHPTTKSYEVNGYMLVQQCVRTITVEEWRIRKMEILKILDSLGHEYLLGDVGYNDKNMANWGVTDDGELVILDYAYCHRLTEKLFICPVCGSMLSYDQYFNGVICTDRANCHEHFSYNQLKAIQGNEVDLEMIENKKASSIVIPEGTNEVSVSMSSDNLVLDKNTFLIRNFVDLHMYEKEVERNMRRLDYSDPEVKSLTLELTIAKIQGDQERVKQIENDLECYMVGTDGEIPCIVDPNFKDVMDMISDCGEECDESEQNDEDRFVSPMSLGDLISEINGAFEKPSDYERLDTLLSLEDTEMIYQAEDIETEQNGQTEDEWMDPSSFNSESIPDGFTDESIIENGCGDSYAISHIDATPGDVLIGNPEVFVVDTNIASSDFRREEADS